MKHMLFVGLSLCVAVPVAAEVDVQIVDFPETVFPYWPIPITAKVENTGDSAVLLPMGPTNPLLMIGSEEGDLSPYVPMHILGGEHLRQLGPGEAWLYHTDVGYFWRYEAGDLVVQAMFRNDGDCPHRPTGQESFPFEVVREEGSRKWYRCWTGNVVSQKVRVRIVEPRPGPNQDALAYLLSPDLPVRTTRRNKAPFAFQYLRERFPTSDYAYVTGYYGCKTQPECLQDLVDERPNHPFARYLVLQREIALIDAPSKSGPSTEDKLPAELQEYVDQRRSDVQRSK